MAMHATGINGKWPAVRHAKTAAQSLADGLPLAAAPTFAVMALLSDVGRPDVLCSAMHASSPLGGMAAMYLLMSAFHLTPWLRLLRR